MSIYYNWFQSDKGDVAEKATKVRSNKVAPKKARTKLNIIIINSINLIIPRKNIIKKIQF